MRAVLFDVDGVLIHGYHARPEKRVCWDKHLERDFGISRERFQQEFIFGPFVKEVLIGKRDLVESLEEVLPSLGYRGAAQNIVDYWLKNDSHINTELFEALKVLKSSEAVTLYVATNQEHHRAKYLMEELGFKHYFKDIFYAAQIGCMKPDP